MKNTSKTLISIFGKTGAKKESSMRLKSLILGLTLVAALFSWGCPNQDPLQAFTPPAAPLDQGPAPVPEPATMLLFGAALLVGGAIARRRRNAEIK